MTYFVGFSNNYDVWPPDEEMLRVEADDPQAAIEQVLRDGKWPADQRLRCARVVTMVMNRKATASLFWLNFEGLPKRIGGNIVFWP